MQLYIVEDGKLVEYERLGECNQCGECCGGKNTITYQVQVHYASDRSGDDTYDPFKEDWTEWDGYTLIWSQGLWWYFKVTDVSDENPHACGWQDTETLLCTHWKMDDWKAICRYWPFRPSDLESFPNCDFSFRRVKDGVQQSI